MPVRSQLNYKPPWARGRGGGGGGSEFAMDELGNALIPLGEIPSMPSDQLRSTLGTLRGLIASLHAEVSSGGGDGGALWKYALRQNAAIEARRMLSSRDAIAPRGHTHTGMECSEAAGRPPSLSLRAVCLRAGFWLFGGRCSISYESISETSPECLAPRT